MDDTDITGLLAQWKQDAADEQTRVEDVALIKEWRQDAATTTSPLDEVRQVFGDQVPRRRASTTRQSTRWRATGRR